MQLNSKLNKKYLMELDNNDGEESTESTTWKKSKTEESKVSKISLRNKLTKSNFTETMDTPKVGDTKR
jgi:hypothetical protein